MADEQTPDKAVLTPDIVAPAPETPVKATPVPVAPATPLTPAPQAQAESETMAFPEAIRMIIEGKKVRRLSWGQVDDYGFLKDSWLTIFTKGNFHTWNVNDGDLEGLDWVIVA